MESFRREENDNQQERLASGDQQTDEMLSRRAGILSAERRASQGGNDLLGR